MSLAGTPEPTSAKSVLSVWGPALGAGVEPGKMMPWSRARWYQYDLAG